MVEPAFTRRDRIFTRLFFVMPGALALLALACLAGPASAQAAPDVIRERVDAAIAKVKPALVRISVVSTDYSEGREWKYESSGSGVIITEEGHVVTNHHVAGHATRLLCTLSTKEEIEAELVGRDPLSDIAVIKLMPPDGRRFPIASFGSSEAVRVGDHVLAMGSPLALSQSVTLGIVSNTELVMPTWFGRWGRVNEDGEDVGSLVRWIGHDAVIFGGNSGGPLVSLDGEIVGINEISIGLGGAIPSDLVKRIAAELIETGKVTRAWLGVDIQPQLKHGDTRTGVLVSGVLAGGPADTAGLKSGDHIVAVGETSVEVRFEEQVPLFNQVIAALPIGAPVSIKVVRDSAESTLSVTPMEREEIFPPEAELKNWGITCRDLSVFMSKELKRANNTGVLVTSVRPGGPAGEAKPNISDKDIILRVGAQEIENLAALKRVSLEITQDAEDPVPTLVEFERKNERFITVVDIGIQELTQPGKEVKKAWLPVEAQVLTRDITEFLGNADLAGFRVTFVYAGSSAEAAGIQVGDFITAVDGIELEANAPEDYEELPTLIRQYKAGTTAELAILREGQPQKIAVVLAESPLQNREMTKFKDENFEFTVREVSFFDRSQEKWEETQSGVLVEEVRPGGWAALGQLYVGDLIVAINGQATPSIEAIQTVMTAVEGEAAESVVMRILRGIHTLYIEMEPKWNSAKK